jgi:class 3 adenylate cyclase
VPAEPDWDELERLGLYDPGSPRAAERRELLERYLERGVTIDEMVAAADRGRLVSLYGDRGIRPSRDELTLEEVAAGVGLSAETAMAGIRAAGLPAPPRGEAVFGDGDIALFEAFKQASELFGTQALLHFVRNMGTAASAVAAGAVNIASVNFSGVLEREGATELELSEANELAVAALQGVPVAFETLFRHHVEHEIRRLLLTEIEPGSRLARLAVGFLDLVGFTVTAADLAADDLVGTVSGFEALASDVIGERGARLVKVIGDEVMFVTHDPGDACAIALDVSAAVERSANLTAVRGGITFGEVVGLDGDFYGTEVNLAARAVAAADPGQILVSKEVALVDGFTFTPSGSRPLKGFPDPVDLFTLSRK